LETQDTPEGTVPNVAGYGLRDALFRLENLGLQVQVKGTGFVVKQSIESGANFQPGDSITITLASTHK
jgi:cell division protein FtsI (penicillin-binding protein 3)